MPLVLLRSRRHHDRRLRFGQWTDGLRRHSFRCRQLGLWYLGQGCCDDGELLAHAVGQHPGFTEVVVAALHVPQEANGAHDLLHDERLGNR